LEDFISVLDFNLGDFCERNDQRAARSHTPSRLPAMFRKIGTLAIRLRQWLRQRTGTTNSSD